MREHPENPCPNIVGVCLNEEAEVGVEHLAPVFRANIRHAFFRFLKTIIHPIDEASHGAVDGVRAVAVYHHAKEPHTVRHRLKVHLVHVAFQTKTLTCEDGYCLDGVPQEDTVIAYNGKIIHTAGIGIVLAEKEYFYELVEKAHVIPGEKLRGEVSDGTATIIIVEEQALVGSYLFLIAQ